MKKALGFVMALVVGLACCNLFGDYFYTEIGTWPKSWPKELEPLRKQAASHYGPMLEVDYYAIPFKKREEFEKAWPHLLKVKSKGAPIILVRRGVATDFFKVVPAGVLIQSSPGKDRRGNPEGPIAGKPEMNVRERWMNTTFIELVVDGEIVDLNRIPLPADTPIIDERFKEPEGKIPTINSKIEPSKK